jgi:hypothetical protein
MSASGSGIHYYPVLVFLAASDSRISSFEEDTYFPLTIDEIAEIQFQGLTFESSQQSLLPLFASYANDSGRDDYTEY